MFFFVYHAGGLTSNFRASPRWPAVKKTVFYRANQGFPSSESKGITHLTVPDRQGTRDICDSFPVLALESAVLGDRIQLEAANYAQPIGLEWANVKSFLRSRSNG
jgi:hypothetical protein